MNHTIKITVGMCSIEEHGETDWKPDTIERIIQALTKASIENGEMNAEAEITIGNAGDLRAELDEQLLLHALSTNDDGFDESGFKWVKIHKSAYLATVPSKDIEPPLKVNATPKKE